MKITDEVELNRKSIMKHLARGDFKQAEYKIEDNLKFIHLNITDLEKYLQKMKVKKDKKEFIGRGSDTIENTANLFEETYVLFKEYKNYNFNSYKDRLRGLTLSEKYDKNLASYKHQFEEVKDKITKCNIDLINSERDSIIKSRRPTNETEIKEYELTENLICYEYKEDVDDALIEERGRQINLLNKAIDDLNCLASQCEQIVFQSGAKLNTIEDNVVHAFENTKNALVDIQQADKYNQQTTSGGIFNINNILLFLILFVAVLFFIALSK
jgi:hypothetical protein